MITSYVILLPQFFAELASLRAQGGGPSTLVAGADCTFLVEWNRYVFGILYLHVYRKLAGRWRKTGWPLSLACHPREDKRVYAPLFDKTGEELQRRQLPLLTQVGLDHFPGLERVFLSSVAAADGGRVSHGLGHMLKNLRRRQAASRRRGTPALRGPHSINAPIAYCHDSSTLPTKMMFHVMWETTGARIVHVWRAGRWWSYFRRQYLRRRLMDAGVFGVPEIHYATWHFGVGAGHVRGHGPSQAPPEQGHSHIKRGIDDVGRSGTMEDVVKEIIKCARVWTSEPVDEEKSFSLRAPPMHIATHPRDPDDWMLHEGRTMKVPGRRDNVFIPSIESIVASHFATVGSNGATTHRIEVPGRTFWVMAIGTPTPVAATMARGLVTQMRARDKEALERRWIRAGILETPPDAVPEAPRKVSLRALRASWGAHCVTIQRGDTTVSTCWLACRNGHCVHEYSVHELAGIADRLGHPVQPARVGAAELRRLDREAEQRTSSHEPGPRKPKRKAPAQRSTAAKRARQWKSPSTVGRGGGAKRILKRPPASSATVGGDDAPLASLALPAPPAKRRRRAAVGSAARSAAPQPRRPNVPCEEVHGRASASSDDSSSDSGSSSGNDSSSS